MKNIDDYNIQKLDREKFYHLVNSYINSIEKFLNKKHNILNAQSSFVALDYYLPRDVFKELKFFKVIFGETMHLPLDEDVRKQWNKDSLDKLQAEINKLEDKYEGRIMSACKSIKDKLISISTMLVTRDLELERIGIIIEGAHRGKYILFKNKLNETKVFLCPSKRNLMKDGLLGKYNQDQLELFIASNDFVFLWL